MNSYYVIGANEYRLFGFDSKGKLLTDCDVHNCEIFPHNAQGRRMATIIARQISDSMICGVFLFTMKDNGSGAWDVFKGEVIA